MLGSCRMRKTGKKQAALLPLCAMIFISVYGVGVPGILYGQSPDSPLPPSVIITEIGAYESQEEEWIEIHNKNKEPVDIEGWRFFEQETNHKLAAFRGDFILDGHEYAIIASDAEKFAAKYPDYAGTLFDSSWGSLKESGETIGLKDAEGNDVEMFSYPETKMTSLERIDTEAEANQPSNWASHPTSHSIGRAREAPGHTDAQKNEGFISPSNTLTSEAAAVTAPSTDYKKVADDDEAHESQPLPPEEAPSAVTARSEPANVRETPLTAAPLTSPTKEEPVKKTSPALTPSTAAPPSKPSAESKRILMPTVLPLNSVFELRGYFVFVPEESFAEMKKTPKKKNSLKEKTLTEKKRTASSQKKPAAKKIKKRKRTEPKVPSPSNGDLSADIKITEVMLKPPEGNDIGEWIEVWNSGSQNINLGSWSLAIAGKRSRRFTIKSDIQLQPNEYRVFSENETGLKLSDKGATIVLSDFEDAVIDEVKIPEARNGLSYALINSAEKRALVASAGTAIPPFEEHERFEWTEPSPGKPNPIIEKLSGEVVRWIAGGDAASPAFDISTPDGKSARVFLSENGVDPDIAGAILREGSSAEIDVRRNYNGDIFLENIHNVPPPPNINEGGNEKSRTLPRWSLWLFISVLIFGAGFNAVHALRALREFRRKRRARYSAAPREINGSQIEKNGELQKKEDQGGLYP
ncbi:lamin tail domain-containing protein [Candidatus Peregrinibacteria bacterium]|nr:lamin tail domain-containing protein [Candidatus Peregrinibacteria bacterium]